MCACVCVCVRVCVGGRETGTELGGAGVAVTLPSSPPHLHTSTPLPLSQSEPFRQFAVCLQDYTIDNFSGLNADAYKADLALKLGVPIDEV